MRFILSGLGIGLALAAVSAAAAAEDTDWEVTAYSKARLIASHKSVPNPGEEPLYVGFQVELQPGWKTYWRSPGDAGLPPVFDWSGSVNVANVELLYPAPQHFEIFNLTTYGYHDGVVYPIKVTPAIAGAPVTLKATVNYLVCEDLCVPVTANFTLAIPAAEGPAPYSLHAGLIDRYLEKVPLQGGDDLTIAKVSLLGVPGRQNLAIRIKGENLMSGASAIAEDQAGFRFSYPKKRILSDAKEVEFMWQVISPDEGGDLAGKDITLTVSDGWGHYEEKTIAINP